MHARYCGHVRGGGGRGWQQRLEEEGPWLHWLLATANNADNIGPASQSPGTPTFSSNTFLFH